MKSLMNMTMTGLLALGLAATASAQSVPPHLSCTNQMYRDSTLTINPISNSIAIQDSFVKGDGPIVERLREKAGLSEQVFAYSTRLSLPRNLANCSQAAPFLFSCNAGDVQGELEVTFFSGSTRVTVNENVQIKSFDLQTKLGSLGSIPLTGNPTTVTLDIMYVIADSEVVLDGESFAFQFETFFYTTSEDRGSSCIGER